jgi:hypothetical protein
VGWFWWLVAINLFLIFIGRASTLTWLLIAFQVVLFLVALVLAAAPPTWAALNKERPNTLLMGLGIGVVVGIILKLLP